MIDTATAVAATAPRPNRHRILIIGSGMSGILMAMKLREAGVDDFIICERRKQGGGVWSQNIYPGVKCDIPAHQYTYRGQPHPGYSSRFADGQQIRGYLQSIANQYDLIRHTRFNTEITSAHLEAGRWYLTTSRGDILIADIVVWAGGLLQHEKYPAIAGRESFAGPSFHSSRWDHDVSLRGKRVGIIGTGSTAAQIIPSTAGEVEHLEVYQRSPQWVLPIPNRKFSKNSRRRLRENPWMMRTMRIGYEQLLQSTLASATTGNRWMRSAIRMGCQSYLKRSVACPKLRAKLTPRYELGCKRLVIASDYYQALSRPNVHLCDQPIDRIDPAGVTTSDGVHCPLDVLIYATGFDAHRYMRPMQVHGVGGQTIDELWREGVYAHRSVALPGFPNFFMIIGPQSPIGNQSSISVAETQVDYLMQLIGMIRSGRCDRIEPIGSVTSRLKAEIDAAMSATTWKSGCTSWYMDDRGNTSMWPWSFRRFKRCMRRVDASEYRFTFRGEYDNNAVGGSNIMVGAATRSSRLVPAAARGRSAAKPAGERVLVTTSRSARSG